MVEVVCTNFTNIRGNKRCGNYVAIRVTPLNFVLINVTLSPLKVYYNYVIWSLLCFISLKCLISMSKFLLPILLYLSWSDHWPPNRLTPYFSSGGGTCQWTIIMGCACVDCLWGSSLSLDQLQRRLYVDLL